MMKRDNIVFLFSYTYLGDKMKFFIKGLIIGIGKIIPGVSGALLAINFGLYDRMIQAVVNFFDNWKENIKFLFWVGSGIMISIVLFSKGISYLMGNYKFLTMMLFMGLILGGTYNYGNSIRYNKRDTLVIIMVVLLLMGISFLGRDGNYIRQGDYRDNIMFFIGGVIEIEASIIPGISGTALMMIMGIYDEVLMMIGNVFDLGYVISNIGIYISYGIGMMISFIGITMIINGIMKKHYHMFQVVIMGLCIYSILVILKMIFMIKVMMIEIILGIMLMMGGVVIGYIMDK